MIAAASSGGEDDDDDDDDGGGEGAGVSAAEPSTGSCSMIDWRCDCHDLSRTSCL